MIPSAPTQPRQRHPQHHQQQQQQQRQQELPPSLTGRPILRSKSRSSTAEALGRTSRSRSTATIVICIIFTITITLLGVPAAVSRRVIVPVLSGSLSRIMSTGSSTAGTNPMVAQPYRLLQKTQLSPDSYLLEYEIRGRAILGNSPTIPTCLKIDYPEGKDKQGNPKVLSKSYSPVSHPKTHGKFELIVKSYPEEPGGGVGKFICDMPVGDSITGTLKKERVVHDSVQVEGRWTQVGLVAGGTGIAPLLQIARILLDSPHDTQTKIHLLFFNRHEHDILGKSIIDQMAKDHPQQFFVTYALTQEPPLPQQHHERQYETGRGTVEMAKKALPSPHTGTPTMIFVCGKDGFVTHWGGPVVRGPPKPDGKKGSKIQGPLEGILKEAGFTAEQVFKY